MRSCGLRPAEGAGVGLALGWGREGEGWSEQRGASEGELGEALIDDERIVQRLHALEPQWLCVRRRGGVALHTWLGLGLG